MYDYNALDYEERMELRNDYATGKWSVEELSHIWKISVEQIRAVCENQKGQFTDFWWLERNDRGRCVAHKPSGARCLRAAISGATVCSVHGGSAPQVKQAARVRLEMASDKMAKNLLDIAETAESEAVKLNATKDALDRGGLAAGIGVTLELKPWERLMGDIAGVANISRAEHKALGGAAIIDAEEVAPRPLPPPRAPVVPEEPEPGQRLMTQEDANERLRNASHRRWQNTLKVRNAAHNWPTPE